MDVSTQEVHDKMVELGKLAKAKLVVAAFFDGVGDKGQACFRTVGLSGMDEARVGEVVSVMRNSLLAFGGAPMKLEDECLKIVKREQADGLLLLLLHAEDKRVEIVALLPGGDDRSRADLAKKLHELADRLAEGDGMPLSGDGETRKR